MDKQSYWLMEDRKPKPIKSKPKKERIKYEKEWSDEYKQYYSRARKKNFSIICPEQFSIIVSQPCVYCGNTNINGIDRINSSKGYEFENCQPCCSLCNMMKYTHTEEIFLNHVKRICDYKGLI